MSEILKNKPNNRRPFVCLHDCVITDIVCNNNVEFCFKNGFWIINRSETNFAISGSVVLKDCEPSDFLCHIIYRERTNKGAKWTGEPITISELSKLVTQHQGIEIIQEYYNSNAMLWKGVLLPYSKEGLTPEIIIESEYKPMIYNWIDSFQ